MGHPFDPLTTLARPAFDTAGNLWVPSSDTDLVFKITPAGAVSVALDATGDGLGNTMDRPLRPVPDTAGNVYVPDSDERVFRIDPAGTVTFLPRAVGGVVEIDASDNIYTRSLAPSVLRATSDDTAVALIDATGDGAAAVIFVDLFAVTGAGVVYATANTSSGHLVFRIEPLCPLHAQVGCRQPTVPLKSKLVFKDVSDDRKDQLSWKWVRGEATAAGAFGDPTVLDYTACAYDPAGHLVFEASIPSGADCAGTACWAPKGTVGFKYLDRDQAPDGIKKSILKAGDDGKAKLQLKGGGANLPDVSLPVGLPLTFQLAASNGECWQAVFSAAGAKKNADTKFVGRAD
jgi:hypothetical protein